MLEKVNEIDSLIGKSGWVYNNYLIYLDQIIFIGVTPLRVAQPSIYIPCIEVSPYCIFRLV